MSASRAPSVPQLRYVRQYVDLFDEIGAEAFRARMTLPVLVGVGLFGTIEGPKGRRTHEVDSSSTMAVLQSLLDRVWSLEKRPNDKSRWISLGQDNDNDIVIAEYSLSSRHCAFAYDGDKFAVADLGSLNGTYVQDVRLPVRQPMLVRDGMTLTLGRLQLVFLSPEGLFRRVMKKNEKAAQAPSPPMPPRDDRRRGRITRPQARSLPEARRRSQTRKVRR